MCSVIFRVRSRYCDAMEMFLWIHLELQVLVTMRPMYGGFNKPPALKAFEALHYQNIQPKDLVLTSYRVSVLLNSTRMLA